MKTIIISVSILFYLFANAYSENYETFLMQQTADTNATLITTWPGGDCKKIIVKNNIAYLNNGAYIDLYDVSNPQTPVIKGQLYYHQIQEMLIKGNYLFIIYQKAFSPVTFLYHFAIIDVTDPNSPIKLNEYEIIGTAGIGKNDNFVIIQGYHGGFVYDMSDPKHPVMSEINFQLGLHPCFKCQNNYLFSIYAEDIKIYQTYFPDSLKEISSYHSDSLIYTYEISGIQIYDNYLYVLYQASVDTGNPWIFYANIIDIVDITDIYSPQHVSYIPAVGSQSPGNIKIDNNYLYLLRGSDGLIIYDITDKSSPYNITDYYTNGYCSDVDFEGNYCYLANSFGGLKILEKTIPFELYEIGHIDSDKYTNIKIKNNKLYSADYYDGLRIFDLSEDSLNEIVNIKTQYPVWDIEIKHDFAFVANDSNGLQVYDIQDINSPELKESYKFLDNTEEVEIDGNYGFISKKTEDNKVIKIIDVSNPLMIDTVGSLSFNPPNDKIYINENYVYFIHSIERKGLYPGDFVTYIHIIDINNPGISDTLSIDGVLKGIFIKDNTLLAVDHIKLYIFNISDKNAPVLLGTFSNDIFGTLEDNHDIEMGNNYICISYNNLTENEIAIINTSNPESPQLTGFYTAPNFILNIEISGDLIFAEVYDYGVIVLKTDNLTSIHNLYENKTQPNVFILYQNYPNPFNPTTTIEFDIPYNAKVKLEIYNLLGEKVYSALDEVMSVGKHKISLNLRDLSTGIYIYKLTYANFSSSRKMLLLK
ncbi:MAG: T9SS type A sorting domain-containing protein [Calditrichaceae bacterium]|nr:T9SS type A sorting domain-containing protein [Calditrichaceae bacterium]MBN2708998.1 T9SS type A sorting domain-containing protein [Calditrichaceae bacterium]RQV95348.1 MAG: T9SS C-terminal target domain-containing protein [Calditrichota bacterium]